MNIEITKAIDFAAKAHDGQKRKLGHPYIVHPLRVTEILRQYYSATDDQDVDILSAAILHDVVEDTEKTYQDIVKEFGQKVASLVGELTSDKNKSKETGKAKYLTSKMRAMSDHALMIKLADRLDNVNSLKKFLDNWSDKYYKETTVILNGLTDSDSSMYDRRMIMYPYSDLVVEIRRTLEEYNRLRKKDQKRD